MTSIQATLDPTRLATEVSEAEYARLLGLPSGGERLERFRPWMEAARDWYARLGTPHRGLAAVGIERAGDDVLVHGSTRAEPTRLSSAYLARRIARARCTSLLVVASSAGEEVEREVSARFRDRPDEAWFLQRFAVAVVEHLGASLESDRRHAVLPAPGHGDWDVGDAGTLLSMLDDEGRGPLRWSAGGALSPSCSSVTVIGIRRTPRHATRSRSTTDAKRARCSSCGRSDCAYRSVG